MKLRCPYCKQVFERAEAHCCPNCGKTFLLPGPDSGSVHPGRSWSPSAKRRSKQTPFFVLRNKYFRIAAVIIILFIAGNLLIGRQRKASAIFRNTPSPRLTRENLAVLLVALDQLKEDSGRYPSTREGLASLILDPGMDGWQGPYVLELKPDPWGRQFHYTNENGVVTLFSSGPDGLPGSPDDIAAPADEIKPDADELGSYPAKLVH